MKQKKNKMEKISLSLSLHKLVQNWHKMVQQNILGFVFNVKLPSRGKAMPFAQSFRWRKKKRKNKMENKKKDIKNYASEVCLYIAGLSVTVIKHSSIFAKRHQRTFFVCGKDISFLSKVTLTFGNSE